MGWGAIDHSSRTESSPIAGLCRRGLGNDRSGARSRDRRAGVGTRRCLPIARARAHGRWRPTLGHNVRMPGGTRTRARVHWIDQDWDWARYQAVEGYLLQTVSPRGAEQGVELQVKQRRQELAVSSLEEAKAKCLDAGTIPTEIKLTISTKGTVTRKAKLRIYYTIADGQWGWLGRVSWRYRESADSLAAMAAFEQWLDR